MKCLILVLVMALAMVYANDVSTEAESKGTQALDEYFQHKEKRAYFYIKEWKNSKSKECTFSGYAPNGPIAKIEDIKPSKATLDADKGIKALLGKAGTKVGKAAKVTGAVLAFSATMMAAVPMLAPALGLIAALAGMINTGPKPQDILNSVNKAIADLTDEVNKKLDQMEGYVDSKVAKAQKELIEAEYASAFRHWAQCIEEPNQEQGNECQRDAVRVLVASRPKFTPLAGKMKGHVTFEKVRKLEAYMLAFRDYANLVIMELTPIVEYYCTYNVRGRNSPHYCALYSDKMKNEATYFIKYAKEAIATIKKGHWGTYKRGNCPNTQKVSYVKKIWEGWPGANTYNSYKATCEIESGNTKKYCTIKAYIRVDGKRPWTSQYLKRHYYSNLGRWDTGKAIRQWAKNELNSLSSNYQNQNHKIMDKYWEQEVLSFVPQWQDAVSIAEAMKKKNPKDGHKTGADCKCDEDIELDQQSFDKWHRLQRRLDAAGHRFVDVEALEDKYAAEEAAMKKDDAQKEEDEEEDEEESQNVKQYHGHAI